MSRKFITDREIAFINSINREIYQRVERHEDVYFAISADDTDWDDLYREAVAKTWKPGVRINALVTYDNPNTRSTGLGLDSDYRLEVRFHSQELHDRDVAPKEGDFIEFRKGYFEITSVTQPRLVFGMAEETTMTKCVCVPAREGKFQAGANRDDGVDPTQPPQVKPC